MLMDCYLWRALAISWLGSTTTDGDGDYRFLSKAMRGGALWLCNRFERERGAGAHSFGSNTYCSFFLSVPGFCISPLQTLGPE